MSSYDSTPSTGERADAQRFVRALAHQWRGIKDAELYRLLVRSDALTDLQTIVDTLGDGCDPGQARRIARAKALVTELDDWNRRPR